MALSNPVRQWGLLSWNKRWITFEPPTIRLFKSETGPEGDPIVTFDLSDSVCKFEVDPVNANRLSLDNSIALIHIKFDDAGTRAAFADAFGAVGADAPAAAAAFTPPDRSRYPEQLGKYWLGPIDPSRPHDEPQGGYGLVKAGVNSETGERVCCKLSHLEYEGSEAQRMEIILQAGLKHPNIVDLKDIVYEKPAGRQRKQICMIMELLTGGELFSEVVDEGGLPEPRARALFRQILLGMAYCHKRKLVHRDIKLENLLLTQDKMTVKIADFGLAKNVSEDAAKTVIGTAKYVAPEMLAGSEYDGFKSDMWSCGVCLYCMTECRFPFTKAGNDGVGGHGVHQTTAGNLRLMQDLQKANYTLKDARSPEYRAFLARLLCPNVADRYTAEEALMDPWIVTAEEPASLNKELLDAMDTSSLVVPTEYTQEQWMDRVKAVMSMKGGAAATEPEMGEEDEEEDAF